MPRKSVFFTLSLAFLTLLTSPLRAQEPLIRISGDSFEFKEGVIIASFELKTTPHEPVFLFLKAKACQPGWHLLKMSLNEVPMVFGQQSLWGTFWRIQRFPVPPKFLKTGLNRLTISSWIMNDFPAKTQAVEVAEVFLANRRFLPVYDEMTEFEVDLPQETEPFPTPLTDEQFGQPFQIRGTKGWAWTPDQYLAEIPYLVKAWMNFLMNCYTSMFSNLDPFINRWWEPLPEAKKKAFEKVVRACQANGIDFCFSMHPQLFSARPLVLDSTEDFEKLWPHYAWMQNLGVKWFNICYDDIGVEGMDKSALGKAHARLVNRLLARLREKDARAQVIFCPTYYSGSGEAPDALAYLGALSRTLHPDIYIFWTGDGVVTLRITRSCAETYRKIVGRKMIIWDNYPVNDRNPTLHLGPLLGRDSDLAEIASGYMSNPLSPQNEANRLPLFTCADYAFNPAAYDPLRSIGQAVAHLAGNSSQRMALKSLIELYPGMLLCGDTRTSFNPVLEKFRKLLDRPEGRTQAVELIRRVEDVLKRLIDAFPDQHSHTKETLRRDLEAMKLELKS